MTLISPTLVEDGNRNMKLIQDNVSSLYSHRTALFMAVMLAHRDISWFSYSDADGDLPDGVILAGMHLPTGDIAYHIKAPESYMVEYIDLDCLVCPPPYDGYTSDEVLDRLLRWVSLGCPKAKSYVF